MDTVWKVLTRKKVLDAAATEQTELRKVFGAVDLTFLGVGSTLGVGVYVLAGHVAKDTAGPSVVLSFLIAAIASVFAGLCYAEFGARTPRAGSAYIYSYVCVGEFIAFVIGWNLILEYVIGSASVARGLSLYLDTLLNNTLERTFRDIAPINLEYMSAYFDFFAFGISVILAIALAFGLKESKLVNNIFTVLNLAVVAFVIIAGSIKADGKNWNLEPPRNQSIDAGTGGFFPFGVEGMIKGAATCFYGFVGFDCIATTGEEVRNPQKAIPVSIILSLLIIFLAYFGTSTVITLMVPYYLQDPDAPIPHAFEVVGWDVAKWIVAIGGIFGLCASLFGAMFPLPRIVYAMASDGLVFRFLGKVSTRFRTPVTGTLLAGLLTGLMAAMFELKQLVNMMSIGTLLAYTIVAASVLLLRFEVDKIGVYAPLRTSASDSDDSDTYTENRTYNEMGSNEEIELVEDRNADTSGGWKQIFNCGRFQDPTRTSEKIVAVEVFIYCVLCVFIGLCAMYLKDPITRGEIWAIVLTAIVIGLTVLVIMSIATQPKSKKQLSFKVPLVPVIPALSILVNIYLMLMLDSHTWIRFGVWMAIGIPTYYFAVRTHYKDARNMSIHSEKFAGNGKLNGFTNNAFDAEPKLFDDTKTASSPPTMENIEATIAVLDEVLEKETTRFADDELPSRKMSSDSVSNNINVLLEENVVALVHRDDVSVTPDVAPPVSQPDFVVESSPFLFEPLPVTITLDDTAVHNEDVEAAIIDPSSDDNEESDDANMVTLVNDKLDVSNVPPPPPPPMPDLFAEPKQNAAATENLGSSLFSGIDETARMNIPRPKMDTVSGVTLRKVKRKAPSSPPVDYSRQNSSIAPTESDDNLKRGTPEYVAFKEKLVKNFQRQSFRLSLVVPPRVPKKPNNEVVQTPTEIDVDDNKININSAKEKLKLFLEKTPNYSPGSNHIDNNYNLNKEVVEKDNVSDKKDNVNADEDKQRHVEKMSSIFGSIKLRKTDSFNASPEKVIEEPAKEKEKPVPKSDKLLHKENMNSVLRSIRLRKVDSFKNNEVQT